MNNFTEDEDPLQLVRLRRRMRRYFEIFARSYGENISAAFIFQSHGHRISNDDGVNTFDIIFKILNPQTHKEDHTFLHDTLILGIDKHTNRILITITAARVIA